MELNQELFKDIDKHLLEDAKPSNYFASLDKAEFYSKYPFTMLSNLKNAQQSPKHHPEGNVWNHTMLVVDAAALTKLNSSNDRVFMWAALLHDVGKPGTTRNHKGKITSYDHDKLGAEMARKFLEQFEDDKKFIEKVVALVRWHMQILFVVKSLPFADIKSMKEQTSIDDVALLGLCDRMGRLGVDKKKEEQNIKMFLEKCKVKII